MRNCPMFTGWFSKLIDWVSGDEWVRVGNGYPAKSKVWLTVYYKRKSKQWSFEWDDLFADPRPKRYTWTQSYFFFEKDISLEEKTTVNKILLARLG